MATALIISVLVPFLIHLCSMLSSVRCENREIENLPGNQADPLAGGAPGTVTYIREQTVANILF